MDKELIELLKQVAGSTESLVIWYMVSQFVSNIISWIGGVCCMYWFGRGVGVIGRAMRDM